MIARDHLESGAGAPRSLVESFEVMVARKGPRAATLQKRDGRWVETTWAELGRRARDVADGLASLGVTKGDRVAVIGDTATEWVIAELGILGAGAICVPIYQSNKAHDCAYILENS